MACRQRYDVVEETPYALRVTPWWCGRQVGLWVTSLRGTLSRWYGKARNGLYYKTALSFQKSQNAIIEALNYFLN